MTQRNHAPSEDYDDVQVDYEVSDDAESVDSYESYNAVQQPAPGKVSKPTVAVVFYKRVPEHCTAYFDELTKHDYMELTGDYVSSDSKDCERLLIGQKYFDPEDNVYYVNTHV